MLSLLMHIFAYSYVYIVITFYIKVGIYSYIGILAAKYNNNNAYSVLSLAWNIPYSFYDV